jgi:hypothetical protein
MVAQNEDGHEMQKLHEYQFCQYKNRYTVMEVEE